jgi:hypothetical protein
VTDRIRVALEVGPKRTFATAIDWPGWSRGAKTEDEAVAALAAYAGRYARVAALAHVTFRASDDPLDYEVVEHLEGGSGTDFGVPSAPPAEDEGPTDGPWLTRSSALLRAAWTTFDDVAAAAEGVTLRKGPRGGGRDLAKITGHVLEAEVAYVKQLGGRHRLEGDDTGAEMDRVRTRALSVLTARVRGTPIPDQSQVWNPWTPRYFVRRSAWHTLDHAWEIEDRATT